MQVDQSDNNKRIRLKTFGILMMIIPIILTALLTKPYFRFLDLLALDSFYDVVFILLICIVLIQVSRYGFKLFIRSQKLGAEDADSVLDKRTEKPVLFLRSFKSDEDPTYMVTTQSVAYLYSDEQTIVAFMETFGPCIAIGNPNDKDVVLGASRIYLEDENWKLKFYEYLEEAQFVIWSLGFTEGVLWELNQILEKTDPEKIIIYIPWKNINLEKRAEFWQIFQEIFHSLFPGHENKIPKSIGAAYFILFDPDWKAITIQPKIKLLKKIFLFGSVNNTVNCLEQLYVRLGRHNKYKKPTEIFIAFLAFLGWAYIIMMGYVLSDPPIFLLIYIVILGLSCYFLMKRNRS